MLGLIAFALLLLACSYWRLSGYLENDGNENNDSSDIEAAGGDGNGRGGAPPVFDEKLLVIMAGQVKPTFLATAVAIRTASFGSSCSSSTQSSESCTAGGEDQEKRDQEKE
ncbi:unnamed protein product [Cuscuta campestris]|uniref:Uncharacterized protein n=1 Tax=Cuscuta campestris TaxID=132261 RepID=A0A484L1K1_9ASTE|nr:unnamed protein product [Cuscuta campestris]